jgi:hypothetical protein
MRRRQSGVQAGSILQVLTVAAPVQGLGNVAGEATIARCLDKRPSDTLRSRKRNQTITHALVGRLRHHHLSSST